MVLETSFIVKKIVPAIPEYKIKIFFLFQQENLISNSYFLIYFFVESLNKSCIVSILGIDYIYLIPSNLIQPTPPLLLPPKHPCSMPILW